MTNRLPPSEAEIKAAVHEHFGLTPVKLELLPLGLDVDSIIYRMLAVDGNWYFMKLRSGLGFSPVSLFVPAHLHNCDVPGIMAPLTTISDKLWVVVDQWAVTLYPFIVGRSGGDGGLSPEQWHAFGQMMRQVHDCQLPPHMERVLRRDSFVPRRRDVIDELDRLAQGDVPSDSVQRAVVTFWQRQRNTIRMLVQRVDELGREFRDRPLKFVLCHADMHPWNVLVDRDDGLWLIDWDEVTLAPKERDLMFAVGGIGRDGVGPDETASFLAGYGKAEVDMKLLAYYRAVRAVEDIAAFGEEACFLPAQSDEARRAALRRLHSLFEPRRIVDIALHELGDNR